MNNRIKFLIVAYLVGLFKLTSVIQGQKSSPNVILIYTDDHGYTDIGALGIDKNVDTPNMDKLARGGALMTAGYSTAPQCVPSRAGLMIGRVQNEFAFPHNGCDAGEGMGRLPRTYPKGSGMATPAHHRRSNEETRLYHGFLRQVAPWPEQPFKREI